MSMEPEIDDTAEGEGYVLGDPDEEVYADEEAYDEEEVHDIPAGDPESVESAGEGEVNDAPAYMNDAPAGDPEFVEPAEVEYTEPAGGVRVYM